MAPAGEVALDPVAPDPTRRALILVPAGKNETLPAYLLSMVAGLPLIDRLILTVWRAGVPHVSLLTRPKVKHCLKLHLSRLARRGGGSLAVLSEWQTAEDSEEHAWLVLTADTLPSPAWLARFLEAPPEPGKAVLAVTGAPVAGKDCPQAGPLADGRPVGLALFSAVAWQDFRRWRQDSETGAELAGAGAEASLFCYLARLDRQHRLVSVAADPPAVSLISRREDLKEAADRLVTSLTGSPWGEGFLEYSVNRRLARRLLLRLATAPISPNQVTALDLSLGLLAVLLFLTGSYWASLLGALLLPVVMILDSLDGMLARLTFRETRVGLMLDLYGDTALNLLVFCALAVGRHQATGQGVYLFLLLPIVTGYLWCWRLTDPLWDRPGPAAPPLGPGAQPRPYASRVVNEIASRDFVYLILLFAVLDRLEWFVVALALGTHLFALTLTWLKRSGFLK